MSKPRVVVHIGTPKTGTTTVQTALHLAGKEMLKDGGMLYASTGRAKHKNRHVSVVRAAMAGEEAAREEFDALHKEFSESGAQRLFITDEGLSLKPRVAHFFDQFREAGYEVQVVCYLRRWDYFAESFYNQVIRVKDFKGIPPIDEFWRDEQVITKMDYPRLLAPWAEVADVMTVRNFHDDVKAEGGLIAAFQRAVGLEMLGTLEADVKNASRDVRVMILLCMLGDVGEVQELRQLATTTIASTNRLLDTGVLSPVKYVLGQRERKVVVDTLRERFAAALKNQYGIEFDDTMPKGEQMEPVREPDPQFLMALMGELPLVDLLKLRQLLAKRVAALVSRGPQASLVTTPVGPMDARVSFDEWLAGIDEATLWTATLGEGQLAPV